MQCLWFATARCCAVLITLPAFAARAGNVDTRLQERLARYVERPEFAHATWGLHVESLRDGAVVCSTNGHRLLQPASSAKLLVAAMALDQFGSEHVFETTFGIDGSLDEDGRLLGRLIVGGGGDFSWSETFGPGRAAEVLDRMAQQVESSGIRSIEGGLVADTRCFVGPLWGVGWAWDDLPYGYGARSTAVMVNDNRVECAVRPGKRVGQPCDILSPRNPDFFVWVNHTVTGSRGSPATLAVTREPGSQKLMLTGRLPLDGRIWRTVLSVPNPSRWFLAQLKQALVRRGVAVAGPLLELDQTPDLNAQEGLTIQPIGQLRSPQLRELVGAMLQASQNQYAQILLLQAGAARSQAFREAGKRSFAWTADLGLETLNMFAGQAGLNPEEVRLDEASGLARSDRVSPAALTQLLRYMDQHRERESFRASLPLTCRPGSRGSVEVRAKSGTMSDIFALAGYLDRPSGDSWVFSVMLNGYPVAEPEQGKEAVWRLVDLLTESTGAP